MRTARPIPIARHRLVPTLLAVVVALHAHTAGAQTGSGTVSFKFVRFSGPVALADAADVNDPSTAR